MSTKRYCDFCGDAVGFPRHYAFYFDMENTQGSLIRTRAEISAVTLFKPMIGKTRERQLSEPDVCLPCIRRIVLEGKMQ